jgi:hypothetical protein
MMEDLIIVPLIHVIKLESRGTKLFFIGRIMKLTQVDSL